VHAEAPLLLETLHALNANTELPFELLLLPDGPGEATAAALTTHPELSQVAQSGTREPPGPPACFNRLASHTALAQFNLPNRLRVIYSWHVC
jgi:hypothetical protein